MTENLSPEKILAVIVSIIGEALMVDPQSISGKTRLFADLESESIDIVDIRFRIELAFGFKIDQTDLMSRFGSQAGNSEVIEGFTVDYLVEYVANRLK